MTTNPDTIGTSLPTLIADFVFYLFYLKYPTKHTMVQKYTNESGEGKT